MSLNYAWLLVLFLGVFGNFGLSRDNFVTFPASDNGTCYKRVLYSPDIERKLYQGVVQEVNGTREVEPPYQNHQNAEDKVWLTIVTCCDGFIFHPRTNQCEPYCENDCEGGTCLGHNICKCHQEGYRPYSGICGPACRKPCPANSFCSAPDVCTCLDSYRFDEDGGYCEPVCPEGCDNGRCVAPNDCRCLDGYFKDQDGKCEPYCTSGCPHGKCGHPENCTCEDGYQNPYGDTSTCQPNCSGKCNPKYCIAPNVCICEPGFVRNEQDVCEPVCSFGCPNGTCIGPENCLCLFGFVKHPVTNSCVTQDSLNHSEHVMKIEPDFEINRKNVSENNAAVVNNNYGQNRQNYPTVTPFSPRLSTVSGNANFGNSDYRTQHTSPGYVTTSTPERQYPGPLGVQGLPEDPPADHQGRPLPIDYHFANDWQQQQQYQQVQQVVPSVFGPPIRPHCSEQCDNGICVGHNRCSCFRGYGLLLPHNPFACLPICEGGCVNADCLAPNLCVCHRDYVRVSPNECVEFRFFYP